ncbi:hypothetical protein BDP67DRAFT_583001 [Colletotrichum lupini]|nr:hypothetical protein BDP67DRAFT_583001 [Colletotrichum lupini]
MADGTVGGSFSNMDNSLTVQLDFDGLGDVHSLFSSPAPSGFTDLFAASDHGIAFFPQNTPDAAPQVVLPSISCKQVVVSQYDVNLVGLAVSTANELYYFEGTRAKKGSSSISWLASGLPIRADVLEISTQYNVASGSTELIYITNSDKTVKHLYLTPQSFLWQEHIIAVRPADGQPPSLTYAAHVTSIHPFSSVTGSSLGADYPLSISSEWAYVTINKSTYTLNTAEPISVVTDNSGSVNIVQRINDSIACPHYTVMLSQFGTTASVSVDPTQRISTQLPKYNTAASLQNATTTDGRPVKFPDTTNFDAAASVLDKFKTVQNTVSNTTVNALAVNNSTESFTLKENGVLEKDGGSWVTDVVTDIESFFGDVWETIKSGLSAGFKFAMNVLNGAVSILVSIAGKVFRFVITTMVEAIRSFAGFLKSALGIDITGFLDWLGFIFDIDKILETQVTVNKAIGSGIDFISYSVEALQPVIVQMFDTIKSQLEQWIPDTREVPPNTGETNFFTKLIGFIFDNPIVKLLGQFNPLGWVMKQADDIFGDVIQLPDLSGLIGVIMAAVGKTFDEEVTNIVKLLSDVMQKFTSVFNGKTTAFTAIGQLLGDAFWTLLDAVKIIITNVVEVIPSIMAEFWKVLTSPIKLPIISTLWEAFVGSDTPLSFLNALTIIPSWVLNIYSGTVFGKMPFDPSVFGNPDEWFPSKDQVNTWLRPRSSPPMKFRASAMPKSENSTKSDSNSLLFASLNETTTNSETANEISGFQRVDLWLCIICPFVTSISSAIDAGWAYHSPAKDLWVVPEFTVKTIGVIMQAVRLVNIAEPKLVGPGYVGDIGVMLQFGVGYALSDTAGDDPLAVGSALTTSLSAIWCCLGRLTVKYEPEFAAVFGILSAEYDVLNAIFCAQILNAADKSSISRSTDQLLTTLARVRNGASQHPVTRLGLD